MTAPASSMQHRLAAAAVNGISHDVVAVAWRLVGDLDVGRLRDALRQVVARHDSLRTTLERRTGGVVQRISSDRQLTLEIVDLPRASSDRSRALRRVLGDRMDASFDLRSGEPLARASLIRIGRLQHVLAITLHHAIADGWSEYVLMRDLLRAYDGRELARRPVMQMADYAAWEASFRSDADSWHASAESHRPNDAPHYPYVRGGPAPDGFELIGRRGPDVAPAAVRRLARAAGSERATVTMALSAAAVMTLAPYVTSSVNVGLLDANRHPPQLRDVIGCVFGVIPVAVDLPPSARGVDVIAAVRDQVLSAYDSAGPPGAVATSAHTRFDVSINAMSAAVGKAMSNELTMRDRDPRPVRISTPLEGTRRIGKRYYVGTSVEFLVRGLPNGTLQCYVFGNGKLIVPRTLVVLADAFAATIRRLALHPTLALGCQWP